MFWADKLIEKIKIDYKEKLYGRYGRRNIKKNRRIFRKN